MSDRSPHRTPAQTLARGIAAVLIIAALTTAGYVAFVKGPSDLGHQAKEGALDASNRGYDLARRIATDLADALHFRPQVTVDNRTVVEQTTSVAELATVERKFSHTFYWENRWAGSTKKIELKGDFVAKAGYDLSQPFSIAISRDGTAVRATMPRPKVLSVSELREHVLQDVDGIWNKLTPEDRENAKNELLRRAREAVEATDLLSAADAKFMERLEGVVRKNKPGPVTIERAEPAK